MFRSGMKYGRLFLVMASIVVFSSCGSESSAPTITSERVGPTLTGYYLSMTISPSIIQDGGSTTVSVRVTDVNYTPMFPIAVEVSGSSDTGATITTSGNGIGSASLDIDDGSTGVGSLTATLENKSVSVSFIVVPTI